MEAPSPTSAAAPATPESIGDAERCAAPSGTSGCSRLPTVEVNAAPSSPPSSEIGADSQVNKRDADDPDVAEVVIGTSPHLCWRFKNGRLVFDVEPTAEHHQVVEEAHGESETVISSKELNRPKSRLNHLEGKLKRAGITDSFQRSSDADPSDKYDANHNICCDKKALEELVEELSDLADPQPTVEGSFCEFDVRHVGVISNFDGRFNVYDELDDDEPKVEGLKVDPAMGTDGDKRHNPDSGNLRSLLKKPSGRKDKRANRVVFDENKNEFFDADYIILIREECDYDDEDDESVCTCNQHEMVRLCCEPNCGCSYEDYEKTPQSPKFAPPIEFVDAVTLSPPEGYKDMELGEQQLLVLQQQMSRRGGGAGAAVCRECSANRDSDDCDDDGGDEGEGRREKSHLEQECFSREKQADEEEEEEEEREKIDQSQQTTPTTPPVESDNQRYILETITMTTVKEQNIMREMEEEKNIPSVPMGSPISGILKGGRLWKQQSVDVGPKVNECNQIVDQCITSDDECNNKRSVRFTESKDSNRDVVDGHKDDQPEKLDKNEEKQSTPSADSTEMTLTFKLGNHVLVSNNSLKPNSAVRQLFPCTKPIAGVETEDRQYLITAESLRAFEEAKRSKLPQVIESSDGNDSIKRAIERNTLRRSLLRYGPRSKKNVQKTDNSLVEQIKLLTCDVDAKSDGGDVTRVSPTGEEARDLLEVGYAPNKSFSPSSSSMSTESSTSSASSACRKQLPDLYKRETAGDSSKASQTMPDIGGPQNHHNFASHHEMPDINVSTTRLGAGESKKQFLSTLAPLSACVGTVGPSDDYYYQAGDRASVASSAYTEYTLEDIDEALVGDEPKRIAPDVIAGTPSASESGDELAVFVQQDAGRMERIKKKYQPDQQQHRQQDSKDDEDDEHDDYGFNRRPSVQGVKPRFGSTTEILQQIQNQLQHPVSWPYYSESGLTGIDSRKIQSQSSQNYQYPNAGSEELRSRGYASPQYRPQQDENLYQNCSNQRCYGVGVGVGVEVSCNGVDYYQSLPRNRNRPLSPPPQDISKNYHQTMVYIPYNHLEGCQPNPYYQSNETRVSNQNQINRRYVEPVYQHPCNPNYVQHKAVQKGGYTGHQPLLMTASRSESPLMGQYSTARSTQTSVASLSTCNYYQGAYRYRPAVNNGWNGEPTYATKTNRHSFPVMRPRYPQPDPENGSLEDGETSQLVNGYNRHSSDMSCYLNPRDSTPNSPTKPRFIERGVPEGAASVSPQDSAGGKHQSSSGTMTSPTATQPGVKPLFYAMNV